MSKESTSNSLTPELQKEAPPTPVPQQLNLPTLGQILRQKKGLVITVTCVVIIIIIAFVQLVYLQVSVNTMVC